MKRLPGPALRMGGPLWLSQPRHSRSYASLRGHRAADVVVVGGGITGTLAAYTFAKAGVSTLLVEGARIGRGSTAASSALLLDEPDLSMLELIRRFGRARTRRIWELSHDAVRGFTSLVRRLRIACDLVEQDAVYWTSDTDGVDGLRGEHRHRIAAGFSPGWLSPGALRRLTGLRGRGGLRTSGNAHFNPYKACLGVAAAAASEGAVLFERTIARRIVTRPDSVRLYTDEGSVDAKSVIVATGYATSHFRPLAGRFRLYRTYVLATPPLSAAVRRELGLGPVMIWDTRRPYHYARWTTDHRLLLGGADRPIRPGQRRDLQFVAGVRQLREDFNRLLPALADVPIDRAWEGLFAKTPDSLPYIGTHRRFPRHLFALGYGGNGMTFGFMAARMLLEMWRGSISPDHQLFGFGRLSR